MKFPKFAILRNEEGFYYFRLYNAKGKRLVTGFPCEERVQCIEVIRQLYAHAEKDHHYRMHTSNYQFYFEMTDANHTVICTSGWYRTMAGMAYGINNVKVSAAVAMMEDHSGMVVT
jgi:uncharacterized protein YegP (UPF0339 family)